MRFLSLNVGFVIAILSLTLNAHASLIKYEISATASGSIGGTTFTDALVELTGTGDTAHVTSFVDMDSSDPVFGYTIFTNPFGTTTVTIAGVGTATITDPSELWAISPGGVVPGAVVIGRIDNPPALDSITGMGALISSAFAGYDGTTAIGPITDSGGIGFPTGCSTPGNDPCVHTTLGLLSFTGNISLPPATEATFVATLQPVPEPTTTLLLLSSGVVLAGRSWLRTGHSDKK